MATVTWAFLPGAILNFAEPTAFFFAVRRVSVPTHALLAVAGQASLTLALPFFTDAFVAMPMTTAFGCGFGLGLGFGFGFGFGLAPVSSQPVSTSIASALT